MSDNWVFRDLHNFRGSLSFQEYIHVQIQGKPPPPNTQFWDPNFQRYKWQNIALPLFWQKTLIDNKNFKIISDLINFGMEIRGDEIYESVAMFPAVLTVRNRLINFFR